jgi:hypothetical protein
LLGILTSISLTPTASPAADNGDFTDRMCLFFFIYAVLAERNDGAFENAR